MSITEKDWQKEQQRVNRVVQVVQTRIEALDQDASSNLTEIVDIRKNFWEDVTVNMDDPDDAIETAASIKQQAEVLSERERIYRHGQRQLSTLLRLKQSPYFGRIDIREEGERPERIYLGIGSLLDEDDIEFLVYDWRAPISSLYYDYTPGPIQYETPGGTVTGQMELKRQFIIRNAHIQSMFDTGVTIGDELLQEVLSKQADNQMKSIVATIQSEQNAIIRNEHSRLLVVQGAAGSGKTSTALQRVAYLLYRYRKTLQAQQVVLFSPNPLFNSYVSTVLPELGEENMQQTTFQEYLELRLGSTYQLEDPFTQMEYELTGMEDPNYIARMKGIQYKGSQYFMNMIDQYIVSLGREGVIFHDIMFRDEVFISGEQMKQQFYSLDSSWRIPNRLKWVADWLLKELKDRANEETSKPWVEEEVELLDKAELASTYKELQGKNQFTEDSFDDFDREQEVLAKKVVEKYCRPIRNAIKHFAFINLPAIYSQLFTNETGAWIKGADQSLPKEWGIICSTTLERLAQSKLAYEDATPYLYLKDQLEGFRTNNAIRYVFIDEAQDYSVFQFAYINKLFPRSKMTVLGDVNQAIFPHSAASTSFEALYSLFDREHTETYVLNRSYRSTQPIVEFTRQLIPGGEKIDPFQREGKKPTVTKVSDQQSLITKITDRIQELQSLGHNTIAVITKSAMESKNAYEALQESSSIRLIKKETASFESGTLVIPAYLAKGVEFDAVIIFDASCAVYSNESERKLFYTACTRAMHELHLYSIGEVTPFLSTVNPNTYEIKG